MTCACGKQAEPDSDTCFLCRVSSVGYSWRGGAIVGRSGFHKTHREHLQEHYGVDSGKELAKTRPDIGRYDG